MKLIFFLLALAVIVPTIGLACNTQIVGWTYPQAATNTGDVTQVTADIKFIASPGQTCNYLLETQIVPQDTLFSIIGPLSTITPNAACCPFNKNYNDVAFSQDICLSLSNCVEEKTITFTPTVPASTDYDHCALTCGADPAHRGNSRDPCKPGFYYTGPGYYTLSLSTWSACYKDDINHAEYDKRQTTIQVTEPIAGCPTGQVKCADGTCKASCGTACIDIWSCPMIGQYKLGDILLIGVLVAVIIVSIAIVLRRKI